MIRILLLGGSGILGSEVLRLLQVENLDHVAPSSGDLDIRNRKEVFNFISDFKPSWIINCAAWTNVDAAETQYQDAMNLNAHAVRIIGEVAFEFSSRVIHISTDYVFDGESTEPYVESSKAQAINRYGETKLRGEKLLMTALPDSYVIRTSWLYGANGKNFVKTMVDKSLRNEYVSVVDDQVGSPTNARDLSKGILAILEQLPEPGIYNFSNGGSCSWFELARFVYTNMGSDPELVKPTCSRSLELVARRPKFSILSKEKWEKAGMPTVINWDESLRQFLRLNFGNPSELEPK
jgi:dTDP-4-dehydrorhamnose reductase